MKRKLILGSLVAFYLASNAQSLKISADDDNSVPCESLGSELIVNGDFNSGNTGFTSGYTYFSGCSLGMYGNGSTINTYNINQIYSCYGVYDRSSSNGYTLHFPDIQGANVGQVFWGQSSIGVSNSKTYKLSIWVYEPSGNCYYQSVGTNFDIYINNSLVQGDYVGGCGNWYNKIYTWHSGPYTSANIEIRTGAAGNFNLNLSGMDLLLDDISFKECIPPRPCEHLGDELIVNGDFNSGNSSFTSGYSYLSGCSLGLYGNGSTINTYNVNKIYSCYGVYDRNSLDGYVIHFPDIQGANVGQVFWEQSPIAVSTGETYNLSIWVYEPSGNCSPQPLGTNFDVYINSFLIQMDVVGGCGGWYNKIYSWNSGLSTTAQIEIRTGAAGNYNHNLMGMDLILDDISFRKCDNSDDGNNGKRMLGIENTQNHSKQELSIMPNPSNGSTVLKSSVNMEIKIINELGQIVKIISLNDRNNHTERLDNLDNGVYFISSNSDNNFTKQKLVITK